MVSPKCSPRARGPQWLRGRRTQDGAHTRTLQQHGVGGSRKAEPSALAGQPEPTDGGGSSQVWGHLHGSGREPHTAEMHLSPNAPRLTEGHKAPVCILTVHCQHPAPHTQPPHSTKHSGHGDTTLPIHHSTAPSPRQPGCSPSTESPWRGAPHGASCTAQPRALGARSPAHPHVGTKSHPTCSRVTWGCTTTRSLTPPTTQRCLRAAPSPNVTRPTQRSDRRWAQAAQPRGRSATGTGRSRGVPLGHSTRGGRATWWQGSTAGTAFAIPSAPSSCTHHPCARQNLGAGPLPTTTAAAGSLPTSSWPSAGWPPRSAPVRERDGLRDGDLQRATGPRRPP